MNKVLISDVFQIAYVTNDLKAALEHYRTRYGVTEFMVMDSRSMNSVGPPIYFALVWLDNIMIELIQSIGTPSPLYAMEFPQNRLVIRLHHVGHLCPDESSWTALHQTLESERITIMREEAVPGVIRFLYADTRDIDGHIREYVLLDDGGKSLFNSIPKCELVTSP